jgi:hypothetical protein
MTRVRPQKRTWLGIAFGAGLFAFASIAMGGQTQAPIVTINTGGGNVYVSGSLSAARYSGDTVQEIGCQLAQDGSGSCFGKMANGNWASCFFSGLSTTGQTAVAGINATSYLTFSYPSASGICTSINVENVSWAIH